MATSVGTDARADLLGRQTLGDGTVVVLSYLTAADRADLVAGFAGLSRQSRYLRFFSAMPTLPGSILDGLLATDPVRHVALCARLVDGSGVVQPEIVGVARYFRDATEGDVAEPAVAVVDALHRRGLGRLLLRALARHARSHGIARYRAHTLAGNDRVRRILAASRGSVVGRDGPVLVYDVDIRPRPRSRRPFAARLRALLPVRRRRDARIDSAPRAAP